jgi:N,N'-diacetyllegionaminate synthase
VTRLFEAKPYVIAEVGSNWTTFEHAKDSIALAAKCGADAVKFQLFTPDAMFGPGHENKNADYACPYLNPAWLPKLAEKAAACGIEFACTAFSPELVAAVDPYVAWHKVASSDCTWPQLLEAVAKTGKPIVMSVGASSLGDAQQALSTLHNAASRTVVLYCVASYPARTVDLRVMDLMRERHWLTGFSDHTLDIIGHPVDAARRGAVVIEKHFTAFPDLETPDRPHSLTPDEFRTMTDHIRGIRKPTIGPTPEEKAMLLRHNRRLVATRNVPAGERLAYGENYGAYRSLKDDAHGLIPFAWRQVEGKAATKAIKRGDSIGPGDFA